MSRLDQWNSPLSELSYTASRLDFTHLTHIVNCLRHDPERATNILARVQEDRFQRGHQDPAKQAADEAQARCVDPDPFPEGFSR